MRLSPSRLRLASLFIGLIWLSFTALAQNNFVYVNQNSGGPNNVTGFAVGANGALTNIGVFPTGGIGNATLFAANRIDICVVGSRLYVANIGSNNISAFNINPATGALTPIAGSPFALGGVPNAELSLASTPNGRFLIVGSQTPNNFTVFSIGEDGALSAVPGSPVALPAGAGLLGVKITPDSKFLIAVLGGLDRVAVFSISSDGVLTPAPGSPFASPANDSPTSVEINCAGNLVFVGANSNQIDVYSLGANGALTLIPGSPFTVANDAQVIKLSPNNQFLFASSPNFNYIQVLNVAANGALTPIPGSPFANPGGTAASQLTTNQAGTLLYVENDNSRLSVFNIAGNGALTPVAGSPFAVAGGFGLGVVAYPPALCAPVALASDQKVGSVVVFPYYTSTIGGASDTRMSISNVSNAASTVANQAYVHLFLIDGTTCQQADLFLCLTPNATFSFKASEYDPGNTGYVIAVAVNAQGFPIQNNVLIGNAFVKTPELADNYGAESFWANSPGVALFGGNTATLYFNNLSYDAVPSQFSVEIQSPLDALRQQIVTAGLSGDLTTGQITGAAQIGTGQAFNEKEDFASFNGWLTGVCQARATISTSSPRVPNGLSSLIKTGQAGYLKFNVGGAVGLLLTPRTGTWQGIRGLHKTLTTSTTLKIPIFAPVC